MWTGVVVRKVLKHDTVKHVDVIGDNQATTKLLWEMLLPWNDCADVAGAADVGTDNPRVDVFHESTH